MALVRIFDGRGPQFEDCEGMPDTNHPEYFVNTQVI